MLEPAPEFGHKEAAASSGAVGCCGLHHRAQHAMRHRDDL